MRRPYQILFPLLSLFFTRVDLTDLWPLTYESQIIRLYDADTALVSVGKKSYKLRFRALDAPEMGQPFYDGKGDAGEESLQCALKVIGRKKHFTLKIYKQDIYGRIMGDLDELSFNLVEAGCAAIYPYAEFSSKQEKWKFIRAWSKARRERRGLWKKGGYMTPMKWRSLRRRISKQA